MVELRDLNDRTLMSTLAYFSYLTRRVINTFLSSKIGAARNSLKQVAGEFIAGH